MANHCAGTSWLSGVTHMVLKSAHQGLKSTKMALDVLACLLSEMNRLLA